MIPQRMRRSPQGTTMANVCVYCRSVGTVRAPGHPPLAQHTLAAGRYESTTLRAANLTRRGNTLCSRVVQLVFSLVSLSSPRLVLPRLFLQNGAMTGRGTLSLPNGHQQSGEFREGVIWRGAWMVGTSPCVNCLRLMLDCLRSCKHGSCVHYWPFVASSI